MYGPHIGFLYAGHDRLESLDVAKVGPAPDNTPDRFETGTLNYEGIAGTAAMVEYLASLGAGTGNRRSDADSTTGEDRADGASTRRENLTAAFETFHAWGTDLIGRLWDGLTGQDRVTLYGPEPGTPRTPTLSFTVNGFNASEVTTALAKEALYLSHGHFYAHTVVERYSKLDEGFVRAGCACYTTMDEVERLIEAVTTL
jgi:selenocysteine lyase/cysteine desulfurase